MARVLIVGEAPSRTAGHRAAFDGRCGERLADWLDLSPLDLRRQFDLVNLLAEWPGADGRASAFPLAEARSAARIVLAVAPQRAVLLAGRRVAAAFGLRPSTAYLTWTPKGGKMLGLLPHPSGVNRWLNDPANVEATRRFLRNVGAAASSAA